MGKFSLLLVIAAASLCCGCEGPEKPWVQDPAMSQADRDLAECRTIAQQQALQSPAAIGLGAPPSPYGLNPAVIAMVGAVRSGTANCMLAKGYRQQ